jgi:hypothetical protein
MRDALFSMRVNEVEATVHDHLAALRADLQRRCGVGDEGLALLVCDQLEHLLADPAPALAEIESSPPLR